MQGRAIWNELCSLRFIDAATTPSSWDPSESARPSSPPPSATPPSAARISVHFERCDRLLKRLRASRLDDSHDNEIRKLLRVDLLLIDDFALQPMDSIDTADIYELIVERHRQRPRS